MQAHIARSCVLAGMSLALVALFAMSPAQAASPGYDRGLEAVADYHYAESLAHFQVAAESGDAEAQRTLGLMLLYGSKLYGAEIPGNFVQAVRWLQSAAAQGCPVSALVLKKRVSQ